MIDYAIILAGGIGSRLQSVVSDVPKPMAPIHDKPFLCYLLQYLQEQNIHNVVLSVGYKYEIIQQYFEKASHPLSIQYSIEEKPLGTGGAIRKALELVPASEAYVMNGDTLFTTNLSSFEEFHRHSKSQVSLALKKMTNFDRYGVVTLDSQNNIEAFHEKAWREEGLINAGCYILSTGLFQNVAFGEKFSFEKDFLEKALGRYSCKGFPCDGYFIDIGIPEDYARAQRELPHFPQSNSKA